jgi:hypothetical protein
MRLQKIIICASAALTGFAVSTGLLEIGSYLFSALQPSKLNVSNVALIPTATYKPPAVKKKQPQTSEDNKYVHKEFSEPGEDGYYYIIGTPAIGNKPKGFKDFDYFQLETYRLEKETYKRVPVKPNGWFSTNISFNFARLKISGKKISFTTETQKGVFYQLKGEFIDETITVKDSTGEDYADTVAIKGLLTKWKNGVKIAEAKVNLGFTIGC